MHERRPLTVELEQLPEALRRPGACFVTLRVHGELRGCMGSLEPRQPLGREVAEQAAAAALRDPRFPAVRPHELQGLELHLSLVGPLEPMEVGSRDELLARLVPGRDGLVLAEQGRSSTFLPAVWSQLPDPHAFVAALERKAGLPSGWSPERRALRYRVRELS